MNISGIKISKAPFFKFYPKVIQLNIVIILELI